MVGLIPIKRITESQAHTRSYQEAGTLFIITGYDFTILGNNLTRRGVYNMKTLEQMLHIINGGGEDLIEKLGNFKFLNIAPLKREGRGKLLNDFEG